MLASPPSTAVRRGLDNFREEDSAFFFGRGAADDPESPIGQLVSKVREHPFVMVWYRRYGASTTASGML
jgi:hypothetical protein